MSFSIYKDPFVHKPLHTDRGVCVQGIGICSCWHQWQFCDQNSSQIFALSSPLAHCPPIASLNPRKFAKYNCSKYIFISIPFWDWILGETDTFIPIWFAENWRNRCEFVSTVERNCKRGRVGFWSFPASFRVPLTRMC